MIQLKPILAAAALFIMPLNALAENAILTIGGAITQTNRGPSHEDDATMLGAHDIAFEKGFALTHSMLLALPQVQIEGALPGRDTPVLFSGPRLLDVLALAGATGQTATVTALDGYGIEMPLAYLQAHDPILALSGQGISFAIGDWGPAVTVFPLTDDPELAEAFAARQIWAVFYIGVN